MGAYELCHGPRVMSHPKELRFACARVNELPSDAAVAVCYIARTPQTTEKMDLFFSSHGRISKFKNSTDLMHYPIITTSRVHIYMRMQFII